MPEGITAENLLHNIMESISDSASKHKSSSFFEEEKSSSVSTQLNRLFGRQKPIHNCLGGGKSADVLLWRNKKISASVLVSATIVWLLFEWLDYHLLSFVCLALILGLLVQFVWTRVLSRSEVPRLVLPEEVLVSVAKSVGAEVNHGLSYLQDVSSRGTLKQFLIVVASLLFAAVIGSWCNFLTVIYIGFVAAHTLPVLYEKYEDEVDNFAYNVFDQLQHQYGKLDSGVLSKIPKGKLKGKKYE